MVYATDLPLLRRVLSPERPGESAAWVRTNVQDAHVRETLLAFVGDGQGGQSRVQLHHAVEYAAERVGRPLPNGSVAPLAFELVRTVDDALERAGIGLKLDDLLHRGSPVGVAAADDFPSVGYWEREEVERAHRRWERCVPESNESLVENVLVDIEEWLDISVSRGLGVLGMIY